MRASLTIRSYNLPGRVGDARAEADARKIASGAGVGLFQEGRHLRDDLAAIPDRDSYFLDPVGALPILVNTKTCSVTGVRAEMGAGETDVGPWGAGPSLMGASWDTGLRVEHDQFPDGLWIVNAHLVPSVSQTEAAVRASARKQGISVSEAVAGWKKRRELHAVEIANLLRMTHLLRRVVIAGDFNCGPGYPGLKRLTDAGFTDVQPGVTHGSNGRIDHFFVRGVRVLEAKVLPKMSSDHRPIEIKVARPKV